MEYHFYFDKDVYIAVWYTGETFDGEYPGVWLLLRRAATCTANRYQVAATQAIMA